MKIAVFILLVLGSFPTWAQLPKPYKFEKDILAAIDTEKVAWNLQEYAVQLSRTGRYQLAEKIHRQYLDQTARQRNEIAHPPADSVYFATLKPIPAIPAILAEAKHFQVLITNEAHYQPENRVFTTALLEALYEQGYRYFCPEGLMNTDSAYGYKIDSALNTRKYPVFKKDYYIPEPRYGELIRRALQIGYTVLPYEHTAGGIKDPMERFMAREKGQADNIAAILAKDPSAKILVHCGYGHLNKNINNNFGLMAAMLKLDHHIDALSVDQEEMLPLNQDRYYPLALPKLLKVPTVFVQKDNPAHFFSDSTDHHDVNMVVFFSPTQYTKGRPDWLLMDRSNHFTPVGPIPAGLSYPVMVFAYHSNEVTDSSANPGPNGIPADIIELQQPADNTNLVLPAGNYTIELIDHLGHHQQKKLKIK